MMTLLEFNKNLKITYPKLFKRYMEITGVNYYSNIRNFMNIINVPKEINDYNSVWIHIKENELLHDLWML